MAEATFKIELISWKDFLAGWIAGICSITIGHPLETIKVRQQMSPSSFSASSYATKMIKNEGMGCFFRGLSYPLVVTGATNSLFFGFSANSLRMIENCRGEKHYRNCCDFGTVYRGWHWDCFVAGCIGGVAATIVNIPVELGKTVSQAYTRNTSGAKQSNNSSVLRSIYRERGIRGCFQGGPILMLRDIPTYGLYAIIYEHIACILKPTNSADQLQRIFCEAIAGGSSGVITWCIAIPIDVVKSRYTCDCYQEVRQYSGLLDCVRKTYKQYGWKAFFQDIALPLRETSKICLLRASRVNTAFIHAKFQACSHVRPTPGAASAHAVPEAATRKISFDKITVIEHLYGLVGKYVN